jgi:hypothetical protein
MGVGKEHKLDLEELFNDIGVSNREVMFWQTIIVNSLSIQLLRPEETREGIRYATGYVR